MLGETDDNWQELHRAHARARSRQRDDLPDGAAVQHDDQRRHPEGHRPVHASTSRPGTRGAAGCAEAFEALERAGYTIGSAYTAVKDPVADEVRLSRSALAGRGPRRARRRVVRPRQRRARAEPRHLGDLRRRDRPRRAAARPRVPADAGRAADPRARSCSSSAASIRPGYFAGKFGVDVRDALRRRVAVARRATATCAAVDADRIALTREGLLRVDMLLQRFFLPQHVGVRYT